VNESSIISRSTFKTEILKIHNYFPHFGTSKNGFCRTIQLTFVVMSAKFTFLPNWGCSVRRAPWSQWHN